MLKAKTIVEIVTSRVITCTAKACSRELTASDAKVGDLTNLYVSARRGPVSADYPLTASELVEEARCNEHPLEAGIKMFSIVETASLMDRWAARNSERIARLASRQIRRSRPARASVKRDSFVNTTFAKMAPKPDAVKPRPKYRVRTHAPERPRDLNAPKNFGDQRKPETVSAPKKNKKGKQKDGDQKQDRKGR